LETIPEEISVPFTIVILELGFYVSFVEFEVLALVEDELVSLTFEELF
jgi:hypothetical protein